MLKKEKRYVIFSFFGGEILSRVALLGDKSPLKKCLTLGLYVIKVKNILITLARRF
jgi:hypothetical protein